MAALVLVAACGTPGEEIPPPLPSMERTNANLQALADTALDISPYTEADLTPIDAINADDVGDPVVTDMEGFEKSIEGDVLDILFDPDNPQTLPFSATINSTVACDVAGEMTLNGTGSITGDPGALLTITISDLNVSLDACKQNGDPNTYWGQVRFNAVSGFINMNGDDTVWGYTFDEYFDGGQVVLDGVGGVYQYLLRHRFSGEDEEDETNTVVSWDYRKSMTLSTITCTWAVSSDPDSPNPGPLPDPVLPVPWDCE